MRMFIPKLFVFVVFCVLMGRLYQLQLVQTEADRHTYSTSVNTTRYVPIRPIRSRAPTSRFTLWSKVFTPKSFVTSWRLIRVLLLLP